jgi:hypothetical protein
MNTLSGTFTSIAIGDGFSLDNPNGIGGAGCDTRAAAGTLFREEK